MYGPADPFAILDIARIPHAEGVSRADITYPDGVMVETRYRLPVDSDYVHATNAHLVPTGSHMVSTATEEEEDGTFSYFTHWRPAGGS
ncbi:hypothetical protein [Nonomuraea sp. NPDC023979]|uniref:hypothetical protein n=1 Tax=Nonomuraea sp. NPDC023979 TaxID=3154796 RepID=UPI0034074758